MTHEFDLRKEFEEERKPDRTKPETYTCYSKSLCLNFKIIESIFGVL